MEEKMDLILNEVKGLNERVTKLENNMATKQDIEGMATKQDIEGTAAKEDIEGMATKEDIEGMATKQDIEGTATKEDIEGMATKEDIEGMATKEDIKGMATKEDVEHLTTNIEDITANQGRMDKKLNAITNQVGDNSEQLNQLRETGDKINATLKEHEGTLNLLARRSIDQEAVIKHMK